MLLSRRGFCAAATVGLTALRENAFCGDVETKPLQVIAYNVHACTGWPKERWRTKQAQAKKQIARRLSMELALYEPDIINFSEAPSEEITKEVANHLGMQHVQFPSGGSWPGALLSRWEIIDSQNVPLESERPKQLFTRHWGRATIRLPNGKPLIVHSAHLYPTADPSVRLREIQTMLATMKSNLDADQSMLLLGDLNHGPDTREYKLWKEAGWVDTFAVAGKGNGHTIPSDIPKWRIDYVMAAGPIVDRVTESRPLFLGLFRLHIADKEAFALSDHLPQLAVFAE